MITHIRGCPIGDHYDSNWDCPNYCDEECKTAQCLCELLREVEQRGYIAGVEAAREVVERASTFFEPLGPALVAIDALTEDK